MKKLMKKTNQFDTVVAFGGSGCSCSCKASKCSIIKAKNYEKNQSSGILSLGK